MHNNTVIFSMNRPCLRKTVNKWFLDLSLDLHTIDGLICHNLLIKVSQKIKNLAVFKHKLFIWYPGTIWGTRLYDENSTGIKLDPGIKSVCTTSELDQILVQ